MSKFIKIRIGGIEIDDVVDPLAGHGGEDRGGEVAMRIEHSDSAGGPEKPSPVSNHCAFGVESFDKVMSDLEAMGIDLVAVNPDMHQCWIEDPDGNVIELIAER